MIVDIDDARFDQAVERAAVPVLVEFWQPGCGGCRALLRQLEQPRSLEPSWIARGAAAFLLGYALKGWIADTYGPTLVDPVFATQGPYVTMRMKFTEELLGME